MDKPTEKLPRTEEAIRAYFLKDPKIPEIAEKLGVELDELIESAVFFVMHPMEQAEVEVAPEKDVAAAGFPVPNFDAMLQYIVESARVNNAVGGVAFDAAKRQPVSLTPRESAPAPTLPEDPTLKDELAKQVSAITRGRKY